MTEAGKQWARQKANEAWSNNDVAAPFDPCDAEFWLSAFCKEVERRVEVKLANNEEWWRSAALGRSLDALKRELLGE